MRLRRNTLNNVTMDNIRGTQTYQTIITDLAIKGAIDRDIAESLLGYEIPYYLHTPDGKSFPKNDLKDVASKLAANSKEKESKE